MREVRLTMVNNIARVIERGEKLDDVLVKSDGLASTANMFKRTSTRLKNRMWWSGLSACSLSRENTRLLNNVSDKPSLGLSRG